jgi:hypothetical protein
MPTWTSGSEGLMKRQAPVGSSSLTPEELDFSNATEIIAITGSFFAAAAISVLLRVYVRMAMLKVFGTDDYVMLLAIVSTPQLHMQALHS